MDKGQELEILRHLLGHRGNYDQPNLAQWAHFPPGKGLDNMSCIYSGCKLGNKLRKAKLFSYTGHWKMWIWK